MDDENLASWEDEKGMPTGARRVLISQLVAQANEDVLKDDKMRIGCFKRTGCLMTLDGSLMMTRLGHRDSLELWLYLH
jgi:hypothetical protein